MQLDEHAYAKELAHRAIEFHGAAQNQEELASLIFILRERARTVRHVLEIGVYKGGTAWLWKTLWPTAVVVGIDDGSLLQCVDCEMRRAHKDCPFQLLEKNTSNTLVLKRKSDNVPKFRPETFDILFIDGDHSPEGVRKDWNNYTPFVKHGGLVILHDVATPGAPGWGVFDFWEETASNIPGAFDIVKPPSEIGIGVVPWLR